MADLRLSFAIASYDRVAPMIDGEVKPDGVILDYWDHRGLANPFYDQIKFQRYDVSEMSMSSYLRMRAIDFPYRILPVFHNRNFSYTNIHIRKGSGIRQDHPEDLKGKRVGIADYQMSLGLWTRGVLQMEFGVKPEDMIWYQERSQHFSHTGASTEAGLTIPDNIELHYAQKDFNSMFLEGELDATTGLSVRMGRDPHSGFGRGQDALKGIGRVQAELPEEHDIVTLFSDPREEAIRFFKKTGVYPPNHCTVVRESILEEYPWVAVSLMEAFEESKRIAIQRLRQMPPTLMVFGQHYLMDLDEVFGPDPFPYGLKVNAKAFDMAQTFSVEQGLTERKQPLDELFPQEIMYREERIS
jgi:4,5-dihydroxyphthalate decarboxylase